jgi:hypothetical protein
MKLAWKRDIGCEQALPAHQRRVFKARDWRPDNVWRLVGIPRHANWSHQ